MREQLDALFGEFGKAIQIPELRLDENGECLLEFDGLGVSFSWDEPSTKLLLSAMLGEVPPEALAEVSSLLLRANFFFAETSGAALGMDPESRQVALCYTVPIHCLTFIQFHDEVECFVNLAEKWQARLKEAGQGEQGNVGSTSSEDFGLGGLRA